MTRSTLATIEDISQQAPRMALVRLHIPRLRPRSLQPGAVAVVGIPGVGDSYFALGSSPDALPVAEVLVKRDAPVAAALAALPVGSTVRLEGPVGRGFDVDRLAGRNVALVGVGSAIAPLRSALQYIIARRRSYGRIALVYGVRDPSDFCFLDEHEGWRAAGVDLHLVVSRPAESGWEGRSGRVQLHLEEALDGFGGAGALVCGMPVMMEETKKSLARMGFVREDVLVNY